MQPQFEKEYFENVSTYSHKGGYENMSDEVIRSYEASLKFLKKYYRHPLP